MFDKGTDVSRMITIEKKLNFSGRITFLFFFHDLFFLVYSVALDNSAISLNLGISEIVFKPNFSRNFLVVP